MEHVHEQHGVEGREIAIGSAEWFRWLDEVSHFSYEGANGGFSAHKESKQRGGVYWHARRYASGRGFKVYLGKADELTAERLNAAAAELAERINEAQPTVILLRAKITVPQVRTPLIERAGLQQRMDARAPFTVIAAPAGFGKSTLVALWGQESGVPLAWLTLDEDDNDPSRFLSYVIAAIQTVKPGFGQGLLGLLQSSQPAPPKTVLTQILHLAEEIRRPFALVLDDYHHISEGAIHELVLYLLDHRPASLYVMLTSRSDPPFPLARWRARGLLAEIRADDLRFSGAETEAFLRQMLDQRLTAAQMDALLRQTEGWITGLQLAALSLRERGDSAQFIAAFTGSQRYILDYLTEEVLERQPPDMRQFLLETAVLERMNGELCAVVTGQPDAPDLLRRVESANLFITVVDEGWYRYHALFRQVLLNHVRQHAPDRVNALHQQASVWFGERGMIADAVAHAFAGQHWALAERWITESAWELYAYSTNHALLRGWLNRLPEEVLRANARLCVLRGWLSRPDIAQAEYWMEQAAIAPNSSIEAQGEIAASKAYLVALHGEIDRAIAYTEQALVQISPKASFLRLALMTALGHYYLTQNAPYPQMVTTYEGTIEAAKAAGQGFLLSNAAVNLGYLHRLHGNLAGALATCESALEWAAEHDLLFEMALVDMCMADVLREMGDLPQAETYAAQALALTREDLDVNMHLMARLVNMRITQAKGELNQALEQVRDAHRLAQKYHVAVMLDVLVGFEAQIRLRRDDVDGSARLAEGLSLDLESPFYRFSPILRVYAVEHLALLKDEIALARRENRATKLEAFTGGEAGLALRARLLQALMLADQPERALEMLEMALHLGRGAAVEPFLGGGKAMFDLLRRANRQHIAPEYTGRLMRAFGRVILPETPLPVEGLSQRELEVLQMVAHGASNREIAERLVISLATVKRHINNIFGKLGVQNRTQAVALARELGMI